MPVAGVTAAGAVPSRASQRDRAGGGHRWRCVLVERVQPRTDLAAVFIDQMHLGQIPARVAHQYAVQVPEGLGTSKRRASITTVPSLRRWVRRSVRVKASRSAVAVGARAQHIRSRQPAGERRMAGFAVDVAVIAVLDPGLGRLVQELEREILNALEHRHQLPFDGGP